LVVSSQSAIEITSGTVEGVDKGLGVERCLCDLRGHMRPSNEGGITEQRDPTEDHLWRFQIEDCLKQGLLGSGDDCRHRWRQQLFGVRSKILDDFKPYQRLSDAVEEPRL